MVANKSRDTKPELRLRSELHRRGLRFRVDIAPVKGIRRRADIVFTRARVAVFVDGCFWHGCPEHFIAPKSNAEYWRSKIQANVERDRDTAQKLSAVGWEVLRFWEHEGPDDAVPKIVSTWQAHLNKATE